MKHKDKNWLHQQYINKKRSMNNIAKECNVSYGTIRNQLIKFNIKIRNHSEAAKYSPHQTTFKKGQDPWNKGLENCYTEETKEKMRKAKLGKKQLKKHIQKRRKTFMNSVKRGKKSPNWVNNWESLSYGAKHWRMKKILKKPSLCEYCNSPTDKNGEKKLVISNKDHKYSNNPEDWQWVHELCHKTYDVKMGLRPDNYKFH